MDRTPQPSRGWAVQGAVQGIGITGAAIRATVVGATATATATVVGATAIVTAVPRGAAVEEGVTGAIVMRRAPCWCATCRTELILAVRVLPFVSTGDAPF